MVAVGKSSILQLIVPFVVLFTETAAGRMPGRENLFSTPDLLLFSNRWVLSVGSGPGRATDAEDVDYGLFSRELVAFVANEVFPEAGEEYESSPIRSRLSEEMPVSPRSRFGEHCRIMVDRLGRDFERLFRADSTGPASFSPLSSVSAVAHGAATFFVIRDIASAFQKNGEDQPRTFSLEPKVSSRRVGVRFGLHW